MLTHLPLHSLTAAPTPNSHQTPQPVAFDDSSVRVSVGGGGQRVPVALWYPAEGANASSPAMSVEYPHSISVAKISRVLLNLPESTPRWLDRELRLRAAAYVVPAREAGEAAGACKGAVVLCHGYLGARYDLVDFAEALAAAGFVVAAPEFAESLADPSTTPSYARPGAPPPVNPTASREEIMDAVLSQVLEGRFGVDVKRDVAILGHSAGAGTALRTKGNFARVAIAGFRDVDAAVCDDPLLVIASAGDGVISLYPSNGRFGASPGIAAAVDALPVPVARLDGQNGGLAVLSDEAPRTAFVTYDGANPSELPSHISFLSARTNAAMVDVLAPLLPLARALDVPLLDFDKYALRPGSEANAVGQTLVPAVVAWLCAVSEGRRACAAQTTEGASEP